MGAMLETDHAALSRSAGVLSGQARPFSRAAGAVRFKLLPVSGAYFQLVDYSAISDKDDLNFCEWLVREGGVAAIPVSAFCETAPDANIVRFCFAKNDPALVAAAERLVKLPVFCVSLLVAFQARHPSERWDPALVSTKPGRCKLDPGLRRDDERRQERDPAFAGMAALWLWRPYPEIK